MRYIAKVDATRIGEAMDLGSAHGDKGDYLVVPAAGGETVFLTAPVFEALFVQAENGEKARRPARKARAREGEEEPGLRRRGAKMQLVMTALAVPQTFGELRKWLRMHGWPQCSRIKLNSQLQRLKRQGWTERQDQQWRLKA